MSYAFPMRDMVGIEQRPGHDSYRGYIRERGKLVRGSWTTYADAKAWRVQALSTKLDGGTVAPSGQTIAAASEKFLAGAEAGIILSRRDAPYASKTLRSYSQAFRDWINPELGHIHIEALRRSQVQRWVDWLSGQREAGTVRNTWAALAALYSYLLPRHDDIANPTMGVRLPRPSRPRERYADREEMQRLLSVLPTRLALPYALAFYAGLRRAEIQALRVEDIEQDWIMVRRALDPVTGFKTPKNGTGRIVPIFQAIRPYLRRGTYSRDTSGLLLPSTRRSRWGAQMLGRPYTKRCATVWQAHGLAPIGLHEARHSFATALIRAGYDVKLVQEWLGHAQASTTLNLYVKHRGREEGLAEKMDTYLAPRP